MKYKLIVIFLVVAFAGVGFWLLSFNKNKFEARESVNLPTKVQAIDEEMSNQVTSSDGKAVLTVKSKKQEDETLYSFYIDDERLALTKLTAGKMIAPFNAWSINDKNFFLKEEVSDLTYYYLEPEGVNISERFYEKFPNYKLQEVTGWAAANLLLINATDGKNDISYWFDINNFNFTRLSNRFN